MKKKIIILLIIIAIVIASIIGVKVYITSDNLYLNFYDYLDLISSYDVQISYYTPFKQDDYFITDAVNSYKSILINLKSGKMYKIEGESGGIDGRNIVTSSKEKKLSQQQLEEISVLFDMTSDDSLDEMRDGYWIVSFEDYRVNPTIYLKELPFDKDKLWGDFIDVNN